MGFLFAHQMKRTKRVLKPRVPGTRIYNGSQSQLIDSVQTLKQRMFHNVIKQTTRYPDKPEDGIIDNLCFFHLAYPCLIQFDSHFLLELLSCLRSSLRKVFTLGGIDDTSGRVD